MLWTDLETGDVLRFTEDFKTNAPIDYAWYWQNKNRIWNYETFTIKRVEETNLDMNITLKENGFTIGISKINGKFCCNNNNSPIVFEIVKLTED